MKNVRIVCYFECLGCVLLDDEHRETLFPEFHQLLEYLCSKFWGDSQGRLVQNDYLGLGHQCSSDAYHLLLSPTQPAYAELGSFSDPGKEPSPFGAGCDALFDSSEGAKVCDISPSKVDPAAPGPQKAIDRFQRGRLSRAVWAHNHSDAAVFALQRDVPNDLGPIVTGTHLLELKRQISCSPSMPLSPCHCARPRLEYLSR